MATIIRLTKPKKDEPVRINFDNVAYYYAKGEGAVIVFVSPNHYEQTLVVKETGEQVEDRSLGI